MTVDFCTFCYHKDAPRIHVENTLKRVADEHKYNFNRIILIHQRCKHLTDLRQITEISNLDIYDSDYDILQEFNIPIDDPVGAANCDMNGPHNWRHHTINHLVGLKNSKADYIVFSDSDISIIKNGPPSWIEIGIKALQEHPEILIVCPSEGSNESLKKINVGNLVQSTSQQIFLCNRERFNKINFHVPWNWEKKAPGGGPFREFYSMMEGRMWRYIDQNNLYRLILDERWRYWHDGKLNK